VNGAVIHQHRKQYALCCCFKEKNLLADFLPQYLKSVLLPKEFKPTVPFLVPPYATCQNKKWDGMTMINRATQRAKISHSIHRLASVVGERPPSVLRYDNFTRKSTWSSEIKIIEIQRSCEHGGLYPLDPYNSLVSRRTGLFYNVKEGDTGQCRPWKKGLGKGEVGKEHKQVIDYLRCLWTKWVEESVATSERPGCSAWAAISYWRLRRILIEGSLS
jgi:hypothetical protein